MRIPLDQISFSAPLFQRPECVICCPSGDMYVSHKGAAAIHVRADCSYRTLGFAKGLTDTESFLPNGIALAANGDLFVANLLGEGGVWRVNARGELVPHLLEVDGIKLEAANFVMLDDADRMWITCTTRTADRTAAMNGNVADGFVVLSDLRGSRVVGEGLALTNECRLDPTGRGLYVCETAGARISRFEVKSSGDLGSRETWSEFPRGTYPDGCAFDCEGHLWMVSPISNRVFRIGPDGSPQMLLEDTLPGRVDEVESARAQGKFVRDHYYRPSGHRLDAITSVAFGGPDLRTVYLGSLTSNRLAYFRSEVAGHALHHWRVSHAVH